MNMAENVLMVLLMRVLIVLMLLLTCYADKQCCVNEVIWRGVSCEEQKNVVLFTCNIHFKFNVFVSGFTSIHPRVFWLGWLDDQRPQSAFNLELEPGLI